MLLEQNYARRTNDIKAKFARTNVATKASRADVIRTKFVRTKNEHNMLKIDRSNFSLSAKQTVSRYRLTIHRLAASKN